MVAVIVGVDLRFFRHQPWERLASNVGIVLNSRAFYFRFLASVACLKLFDGAVLCR